MYKILLFLLIPALLARPRALFAQDTGLIEGEVTIAEGALASGLEVEMLFLPNGQGPPVITSQPLGSDGLFRFSNVDTSPEHRYLVRVKVDGEDNYSELLAFAQDESSKQVTLRLFERTTDASALSLPQVNYVLDLQASGWVVVALYRYQNSSEQIIVNLTNPPAFMPLPTEATNLQFLEEIELDGVVEQANGFAYTGPFAPGEIPFIFSYHLPYSEGEQTLTLPIAKTAGKVAVLVPQLGQTSVTDDLTSTGKQEFEGVTFEIFEAPHPGLTESTFRFSDLPLAPTPEPSVNSGPSPDLSENSGEVSGSLSELELVPINRLERLPSWAPLLPMALAALTVFGYLAFRPAPSYAEERSVLRKRRETLLAEMAMLDIRFESRAIGEQTHRRQRGLLKRKLKEILHNLGTAVP